VHHYLEVEPLQTWYYHISLNFHTLVILLQVDLALGDEHETIYEGFYEIENISIFAQFSIFGIGHYCWLLVRFINCPLIARQITQFTPFNTFLNFLQL